MCFPPHMLPNQSKVERSLLPPSATFEISIVTFHGRPYTTSGVPRPIDAPRAAPARRAVASRAAAAACASTRPPSARRPLGQQPSQATRQADGCARRCQHSGRHGDRWRLPGASRHHRARRLPPIALRPRRHMGAPHRLGGRSRRGGWPRAELARQCRCECVARGGDTARLRAALRKRLQRALCRPDRRHHDSPYAAPLRIPTLQRMHPPASSADHSPLCPAPATRAQRSSRAPVYSGICLGCPTPPLASCRPS